MQSLRLQRSASVYSTRIWHCAPTEIRQFCPQTTSTSPQFRFSGRCDLKTLSQHIALTVLSDHLRDRAEPFLADVGIKGPKTTYNNQELASGIRRYVVKHIQNLDSVLADLERASITIGGAKSQF